MKVYSFSKWFVSLINVVVLNLLGRLLELLNFFLTFLHSPSNHVLIEFCRNNNMIICNGRVGKDKGVGEFTCKHSSVVDYYIVSPNGLKIINSFSILEPSKLFSDVHSPLSLTLKCYIQIMVISTKLDQYISKSVTITIFALSFNINIQFL
jgi:hypothetical protein